MKDRDANKIISGLLYERFAMLEIQTSLESALKENKRMLEYLGHKVM